MKRTVLNVSCIVALFSLSCCWIGCSNLPKGYRLYSGTPQSPHFVAMFHSTGGATIARVQDEGNKQNTAFIFDNKIELLPGNYTLSIGYSDPSGNVVAKNWIDLRFKAHAGHVYVIYPEFPQVGLWKPTFVDIVHDEDYNKINCTRCLSAGELKDSVQRYFQGERPRRVLHGEQSRWQ